MRLAHRFAEIGSFGGWVSGAESAISGIPPAKPQIIDVRMVRLGANRDGRERIVPTAMVTNEAGIPAVANLTLTEDGTVVETKRAELSPGVDRIVEFTERRLEAGITSSGWRT